MTPEALDSLCKQELIALVLAHMEQIRLLTARVEELEARLNIRPRRPAIHPDQWSNIRACPAVRKR
jgi:hypothetical protein